MKMETLKPIKDPNQLELDLNQLEEQAVQEKTIFSSLEKLNDLQRKIESGELLKERKELIKQEEEREKAKQEETDKKRKKREENKNGQWD
jgi:hypothetical protein